MTARNFSIHCWPHNGESSLQLHSQKAPLKQRESKYADDVMLSFGKVQTNILQVIDGHAKIAIISKPAPGVLNGENNAYNGSYMIFYNSMQSLQGVKFIQIVWMIACNHY